MTVTKTLVLIMLGLTLGLAACGRKAPLDTPYQAAVDARKEAADNDEPLPPEPKKPEENRRFILDPLID